MVEEVKLVKKVKRLLRRLKCPTYLHRFGPKKYEFYEHVLALLVMHYCRLSYRRVKKLLDLLGIRCPSKSALQATVKKISSWLWNKILAITSGVSHYLVAIDATGFSRANPSYYYLKRIDGKMPKIAVKLSTSFDTRKKKFIAAKIRVLPAHDIKDAKILLERSKPNLAVLDKGYGAESLYEFAEQSNIVLMCPSKKNVRRGRYRKKMKKLFRLRTYHRRELIESGFSSIKRKFGASVSSKKAVTIRAEVYCKLICHNLFICFLRDSGQSLIPLKFQNLY